MTKPLKLLAANDTFAALVAVAEVIDGKQALFVTPPEVAGLMPEVHGLPTEVDDDVAVIIESSGSTGVPKRIGLTVANLLSSARATQVRLGGPGQWLLALPINYIAGLQVLVRSHLADTQPVLMNTSVPFSADGFARASSLMNGERRYTSLVPTQLERLNDAIPSDPFVLEQLRTFDAILVGGQAPNPATVEHLRGLGVKVAVTYGMTETAGGCVYDGVPLDGVRVELGERGLITLSGPMVVGGSVVTNDLGEFDEHARLHILGRADRVINSGGIKLSLDRVEQWAKSQPGVRDAVSLPLSNPQFGETFICWMVVFDPERHNLDTDKAVTELGLPARFAVWATTEEVPLLENGKPDYQGLAENFAAYQNQLREARARGEI
jgi:O-succinylbenzoic acid--CoA ligase